MIGRTLAHYKILSAIGAGGMGQVYCATDTKLNRNVALKVLPTEVGSSTERLDRFQREAKALAALDHPGIVTVYSVEEVDGIHFLTMQLVEGKSLDSLIPQSGFTLERFLEIATPLADALTAAHERGIIHRDLKPPNIMIGENGRVKVLDFGLAKVAESANPQNSDLATAMHTREGVVMGTMPYMSPEQVEGRDVDARTDIFSLGVVFHEMATGKRPFQGPTAPALISSILRDPAPPLSTARPDLPDALNQLILRCLEKNSTRRIQTAKEIQQELEALRRKSESTETSRRSSDSVPGFRGRPAIAVLPFDNLSQDPEQEYFADGLTEDLITRLSMWRSFPVMARNSTFVYKRKAVDIKQIAADLRVRYVVEGSVRKAGTRVRITAQLIDATTGEHVWAKTYDRDLTDVFAVQDEISEAIAASLASDLQRAEHARAQRRPPENLEAWELYQRALPHLYGFTRDDMQQARALLERAVALDPQFSTPLARLSEVGIWEVIHSWTEDHQRTLEAALTQARKAVALDPRDAEAHAMLSFALLTAGDSSASLESARRAVNLNPSFPLALAFLAYMSNMTGHPPQDSIDLVQRAMRLSPQDPMEWIFYDALGGAYWNAARYEEGFAVSKRLIAMLPDYYFGYIWGALNLVELGRIDEAKELIQQGLQVQPALSLTMLRKGLGAIAPDVDRRMADALLKAGIAD